MPKDRNKKRPVRKRTLSAKRSFPEQQNTPTKPEKLIFGDVIQFKANAFVNGKIKESTFTAMFVKGRFGDEEPLGIEVMLIARPGSFEGNFSKNDLDVTDPDSLKKMGINTASRVYIKTIFIPTDLFKVVFMPEHDGVFADFKDARHDAAKIGALPQSVRRSVAKLTGDTIKRDQMEAITIANFTTNPLTQKFLTNMSTHGLLNATEEFQAAAYDATITSATQLDILPDYFKHMLGKHAKTTTVRMLQRLLNEAPDMVLQQLNITPETLPAVKAALKESVEALDKAVLTGFIEKEPYKSRVKLVLKDNSL